MKLNVKWITFKIKKKGAEKTSAPRIIFLVLIFAVKGLSGY